MTTAKYSYAHADQPLLNEVRLSFRLSSRPQLLRLRWIDGGKVATAAVRL